MMNLPEYKVLPSRLPRWLCDCGVYHRAKPICISCQRTFDDHSPTCMFASLKNPHEPKRLETPQTLLAGHRVTELASGRVWRVANVIVKYVQLETPPDIQLTITWPRFNERFSWRDVGEVLTPTPPRKRQPVHVGQAWRSKKTGRTLKVIALRKNFLILVDGSEELKLQRSVLYARYVWESDSEDPLGDYERSPYA